MCLYNSQEEKARLRCRAITYAGEFEPVKRSCRAPLPNGSLCPRRDRIKVSYLNNYNYYKINSIFDQSLCLYGDHHHHLCGSAACRGLCIQYEGAMLMVSSSQFREDFKPSWLKLISEEYS